MWLPEEPSDSLYKNPCSQGRCCRGLGYKVKSREGATYSTTSPELNCSGLNPSSPRGTVLYSLICLCFLFFGSQRFSAPLLLLGVLSQLCPSTFLHLFCEPGLRSLTDGKGSNSRRPNQRAGQRFPVVWSATPSRTPWPFGQAQT